MSFLQRLQEKPESVRRRITFGVAFGVTVLIVVVWIPTVGSRARTDATITPEAPSPTHALTEILGSFLGIFTTSEKESVELLPQQEPTNLEPAETTTTISPSATTSERIFRTRE